MCKFIMSCTTCAFPGNGDEVADTFKHTLASGYKNWGKAGPALWTAFIFNRYLKKNRLQNAILIDQELQTCI